MTVRRIRPFGEAISLNEMLKETALDKAWAQAVLERTRAILADMRCMRCEQTLWDCRCTDQQITHWVREHPLKVRYAKGTR